MDGHQASQKKIIIMGKIVNLNQLTPLARISSEFSNLSDDYMFTRITADTLAKGIRLNDMKSPERIDGPIRIDGISWILCFTGSIKLDINLSPVTLTSNCIAITTPGSMIELVDIDRENLDCYLLFVSTNFMHDINFDINVFGSIPRLGNKPTNSNMMKITDEEGATLREYFDLLYRNSSSSTDKEGMLTKSIARNLIAALTYQVVKMASQRTEITSESKRPGSRRALYVNEFMRLVHEHHMTQRSVSFYAEKIFISPKYLSLIIKETTGRSATEVIDSYVILEAKSLLRFSGKNVQQIAYELNFPNQSSFGKYFKHLTGMSPSEYQKS